MSQLGERIAKRLIRDHGYVFVHEPMNFCCHRDQEAINQGWRAGMDMIVWNLRYDPDWTNQPLIVVAGKQVKLEIGSCQAASYVARAPKWVFMEHVTGCIEIMGGES